MQPTVTTAENYFYIISTAQTGTGTALVPSGTIVVFQNAIEGTSETDTDTGPDRVYQGRKGISRLPGVRDQVISINVDAVDDKDAIKTLKTQRDAKNDMFIFIVASDSDVEVAPAVDVSNGDLTTGVGVTAGSVKRITNLDHTPMKSEPSGYVINIPVDGQMSAEYEAA